MAKSNSTNSKLDKFKRILGFGRDAASSKKGLVASTEKIQSQLGKAKIDDEQERLPSTQMASPFKTGSAPSTFKQETRVMENNRRDLEQTGHRRLGISVRARERVNDEPLSLEQGIEAEAASSLMQNPLLDNQRFDGIDPNVNPVPAMNTEARVEYDNIKREQELQKQLRLGLSPDNAKRFTAKPTPRGY